MEKKMNTDKDIVKNQSEFNNFCTAVDMVLSEFGEMLKEKNKKYGNSALDPIRIFSKANPKEQIKIRIDDKISRLIRGTGKDTEDIYLDLTGYLILLMILDRELL